MAFGAWEDGGRERKAYGVMGIELRAREPSVAEGVAPLRLAWSDGAGFRGVFWTSFRNWSLFIFVVFPRRMVWWLRRRKVDGRWKYFEVMDGLLQPCQCCGGAAPHFLARWIKTILCLS